MKIIQWTVFFYPPTFMLPITYFPLEYLVFSGVFSRLMELSEMLSSDMFICTA